MDAAATSEALKVHPEPQPSVATIEPHPSVKTVRHRQNFSWRQMSVLEQVFDTNPLPPPALRTELAHRLGLTPRCVQVWFQNRRQKVKSMQQNADKVPVYSGQTPMLTNGSSTPRPCLDALLQLNAACVPTTMTLAPYTNGSTERQALEQLQSQMARQQAQFDAVHKLQLQELHERRRENDRLNSIVMSCLGGQQSASTLGQRVGVSVVDGAISGVQQASCVMNGPTATMVGATAQPYMTVAQGQPLPCSSAFAHPGDGRVKAEVPLAPVHVHGLSMLNDRPTMQVQGGELQLTSAPVQLMPAQLMAASHASAQSMAAQQMAAQQMAAQQMAAQQMAAQPTAYGAALLSQQLGAQHQQLAVAPQPHPVQMISDHANGISHATLPQAHILPDGTLIGTSSAALPAQYEQPAQYVQQPAQYVQQPLLANAVAVPSIAGSNMHAVPAAATTGAALITPRVPPCLNTEEAARALTMLPCASATIDSVPPEVTASRSVQCPGSHAPVSGSVSGLPLEAVAAITTAAG